MGSVRRGGAKVRLDGMEEGKRKVCKGKGGGAFGAGRDVISALSVFR
jgi:hypothetical protein